MGQRYGIGTLIMILVLFAGFVVYQMNVPQNGPGQNAGAVKSSARETRTTTHWVASAPHWENRPAMIGALSLPGFWVCALLWKFVRGPHKNMGLFLASFLASLVLGGLMAFTAVQLEAGGHASVLSIAIPLFETLGTWGPAYVCGGIGALSLVLAFMGSLAPAAKPRDDEFEDPQFKW
jgi:hypothetical protein